MSNDSGPGPSGAAGGAEPAPAELATPVTAASRGRPRWGYFVVLSSIAVLMAAGLFALILYADGIDPYLQDVYLWLLRHPGVTSVAALSPLLCSLLVGYGYARRARRRRALAARRAAGRGVPVSESARAASGP